MPSEKKRAFSAFIACFICMFVVQGGMQSFAIFLPQIASSTGWSVSQVAVASSTAAAGAFAANLAIAPVLRRVSPKTVLSVGLLAFAAQEGIFALSTQPWMFWLGGAVGGIAMGWGTVAPCSIIIDSFFVEERSKYMSITVSAAMFGSVAFNPFDAAMIARFGWRSAYLAQGVLVLGVGLCAVHFLIGDLPMQRSAPAAAAAHGGLLAAQARKTVSYWLLLLGIFLIGLSTNIENYMPAFWQSRGVSAAASSAVMTAYAAMAAVMSIVMGRVNERLSAKIYTSLASLLFSAALLIMAWGSITESLALLLACCLLFAAGGKKASSLIPPLVVAETFGRRDYAALIGVFAAMLQLGVTASNFVLAPLLNIGYTAALSAMVLVNLAALVCILSALIAKPYRPEQEVSSLEIQG